MRASPIVGFVIAASLALAGSAGTAWAQVDSREGIALQNQMSQLRQELLTLRDQVSHGGTPMPSVRGGPPAAGIGNDMVAQLLTRVDGLEDQLRQLRGRNDELQNQMQRQNAELGKRVDDLAYQMHGRAGADAPPAGPVQLTPPLAPSQPPPNQPVPNQPRVRTPEVAMQEGNAALARRDYAAAEQAGREAASAKASPRAYDGQFLLAQSLFGQRKYSEAAISFDDAYKFSRKGAHAQDALLGLANALTGINEKKAACGTLDKLRAEFPQPRGDLRDGIATAAQRAGCK